MRRVVITGFGIISSLGNDPDSVADSLREGRSGIRFNPLFAEHGFRSQVSGSIRDLDLDALIDRKFRRFMAMPQHLPVWRWSRPWPCPV